MALSNSTNVRLSEDVKTRLNKIAVKADIKSADLIRMAVEEYLDKVETTGKITINLAEKPAAYGTKKSK